MSSRSLGLLSVSCQIPCPFRKISACGSKSLSRKICQRLPYPRLAFDPDQEIVETLKLLERIKGQSLSRKICQRLPYPRLAFDPFQEFEGLDDLLVRVLAG